MTVLVYPHIFDPFGLPLTSVPGYFTLDYTLNAAPGAIGVLELETSPAINPDFLFPDGRIGVFRSIDGNSPYLDNGAMFLIETFKYTATTTFLRAFHVNILAARRRVAYAAGSSFTVKAAAPADNLIKTIWKENAGSSITAARFGTQTGADLSSYVSVEPNASLGASIAAEIPLSSLDQVFQALCDASATAGTYLTYEIFSTDAGTLMFRTYTTLRGIDRRYGTANPTILSESRGNLQQTEVTIDYHDEVTAAIAMGAASHSQRLTAVSLDTTRINISPFHRIEDLIDAGNITSTTALLDRARALIRNKRPNVSIKGKLVDTPRTTRGIHYDLGDMLTVENPSNGESTDVRLDLIHEHIESSGGQAPQDLTAHQVQHRYATGGLKSI